MIELEGTETCARVMGVDGDSNLIDDACLAQIRTMIDHEAFDGPVRIMPDAHWGKGSVVGFTMPLGEYVVPNVVGVDIGCGMTAGLLGDDLPLEGEGLDQAIRERIPMGFGPDGLEAPEREYYHVGDSFPWKRANLRLESFLEVAHGDYRETLASFLEAGGYDLDYFKTLCAERAGTQSSYFSVRTAIESVGTLGSGNHFLEIGQSETTGAYWVVVHSGSRGLGANTAEYWQAEAARLHDDRVDDAREILEAYPTRYLEFDPKETSDSDVLEWLQGGMGEDFVDYEALKADFLEDDPSRIETVSTALKAAVPNPEEATGDDLAYLEGRHAARYLIDMVFCQHYAAENRRVMIETVADVLDTSLDDRIESTHNYIDFRDGIIRKGATRAYEGERVLVPFNMADGTLICEGRSNPAWNYSVCHGAGRVMSRTQAHEEFDAEAIAAELEANGVHSSVLPVDEAPGAYKNSDVIETAIGETATVVDRLEVVHNVKAES
ncbi:RtcB family protein [Natrialbaceae archaeon A-CW2]